MSDSNNLSSELNNNSDDFSFSDPLLKSNLISGERVFSEFFIPHRTISLFGLVVLLLSFLLPLIVILVVQFGTDFSKVVKYTIDIIMGLWLFFTFLFFFFIGSSNLSRVCLMKESLLGPTGEISAIVLLPLPILSYHCIFDKI